MRKVCDKKEKIIKEGGEEEGTCKHRLFRYKVQHEELRERSKQANRILSLTSLCLLSLLIQNQRSLLSNPLLSFFLQ